MAKEEVKTFLDSIEEIKKANNNKLAWLLLQCPFVAHLEILGKEDLIINEVVERLYPEYDGESIKLADFGWKTQNGEIRYI